MFITSRRSLLQSYRPCGIPTAWCSFDNPLPAAVQTCKFKGLVNDGIQIKASFSEDGALVVSGSEDGQVSLL